MPAVLHHPLVIPLELEPRPRMEAKPGAVRSGGSVVALFVAHDSIYKKLGCDCFDIERNALTYQGNSPVVAHPPCQLWGKMANVNFARWGGEHNRPGNDGGCFQFALDAVNRCGGVMEHPADSYAWAAHGLTKPLQTPGWLPSGEGWVCEVWQSAYGHRARKRTWLYYRGERPPIEPRWSRPDGTHQVGFHDQRGKTRNKPTLGKREANATPLAFAEWLLSLVRWAAGAGRGASQAREHSGAQRYNDDELCGGGPKGGSNAD